MRELRKLASQLGLPDYFLRIKFLKAIPDSLRPTLASYDASTSLEELARVTDTLMDYAGQTQSVSLVVGAEWRRWFRMFPGWCGE